MATYDPNKAATFNSLRQQGLSEDAAAAQAGISEAESGNYTIGSNGQMGPAIAGTGTVTVAPTAAETAESARFTAGLESPSNFEQVNFQQTANSEPGRVQPVSYTTTSTTTVSGGGTQTVIAGARQATAESTAIGTAYDAKNAEYNEFIKNNPSQFQRRRQGLPPMTPEEQEAYNQRLQTLNQEKEQLKNAQVDAEASTAPTQTFTPNTTTTTTTVVTGTAVSPDVQNNVNPQNDESLFRQTEVQIGSTIPSPPLDTPTTVTVTPVTAPTVEPIAVSPGLGVPYIPVTPTTIVTPVEQNPVAVATPATQPITVRIIETPTGPPAESTNASTDGVVVTPVAPPTVEPIAVGPDPQLVAVDDEQAAINQAINGPEAVANDGSLAEQEAINQAIAANPLPVDDASAYGGSYLESSNSDPNASNGDTNQNDQTAAGVTRAQNQSTLQTRVAQAAAADWRVRISLADNSNYLYNLPTSSKDGNSATSTVNLLAPLRNTNGVIFPYTPSIETTYHAKYENYDLIHSNYRGYFYRNSYVDAITIKGTFTAQDTKEAQYLLAVIHFFRTVTKMFYGTDAQAGTPPPLVFLNGLGQYQFNKHPCVVSTFNYSLPTDVDYIRADGFNNIGLNLQNRRNQDSGPGPGGMLGVIAGVIGRLTNSGLNPGATNERPGGTSQLNQNVQNQGSINSTYVPTKMEISVTLLPIQTRNQVSKQFNVKDFASGALLKGGFW